MDVQVSSQAPQFRQRLPLKQMNLPQRMSSTISIMTKNEHEPDMSTSSMPHLPCILNSAYLMGMPQMLWADLKNCISQKESLHRLECVREMQCANQSECLKIQECVEMKNMKVDSKERKETIQCLTPMKCLQKEDCTRRLDCLFVEQTNANNFSFQKWVKEFGVSVVTCLQPITWFIILIISIALPVPLGQIIKTALRGVWNHLKFWSKPARYTADWFGRKFMAYRGELSRFGEKYAIHIPQPLVPHIEHLGLKPAQIVEVIGWALTLGSLATFAVLICTFLTWLLRSRMFWLANIMIRIYIWLKSLLPRLY